MLGQLTVPKNLCLLRLSAIGDVCHAVALVQHIQQHWPQTHITWVVGKVEAQLLVGLPNVELVIFDKNAGWRGYWALWRAMRGRKFDVLLHMQVALRASLASLCISATTKMGFDKQRAKEAQGLFCNKRIAAQQHPHVLDGFMGFAHALGLPIESPHWHMPLSDEVQLWASEQFVTDSHDDRPTIAPAIAIICPSASKKERSWHAQGYASIADSLTQKGFTVVICGGNRSIEHQLAQAIIGLCRHPVHNYVGQTSLPQLLALLNIAHLVLAPDTGPLHMAVTVNTPVVGLYAHSNPHRTGPYTFQHYVVSCYPEMITAQYHKSVAKLPWGIRAKGEQLMDNISVAQVEDKIRQLIEDHYPELV